MHQLLSSDGVLASPPLLTTALSLPDCEADAWVVVDSTVHGLAMGGTRLTETVDAPELAALARAMTHKLALVDLPIGGAKAGIRPRSPITDRDRLMRTFGRVSRPLLRGGVYLGCDQGTTPADRDTFFAAAGYDLAEVPGSTQLDVPWEQFYPSMSDITGYGVAVAALSTLEAQRVTAPQRVVVQGFGVVGRAAALHLERAGHRVVAVADVLGTVADPAGLSTEGLIAATSSDGTLDRSQLPSQVRTLGCPDRAWLTVDTDVLVLAAGADAIGPGSVPEVRARVIVEGGNLSCGPVARRLLREAGHTVLPDVVVNAGGAALTGAILTGTAPSGLPAPRLAEWLRGWIADKIRHNCALVTELSGQGSADPVAELLARRAVQP
ncbi:Glu/Leu/Phe/Val dehydrogenase dimerization domain-containing protein [Streptomyces sp. NPDC058045]|uniref:Glu/Leu/Phe/Val dehydrogenase dimerization domain-containing protein n=1 Tax=Streptomyces sp. NPDC058045 TaxID=3346311 RepID=UPI0036E90CDE